MVIQASRELTWERLVETLPPEHRRVGKVDMVALQAADDEKAKHNSPENSPSSSSQPIPFDAEILDWREGHSFVARFSSRPYLRGLVTDVWLKDLGLEKTTATIRLELTLGFGCLLMIPARIGYRLFRQRIDRLILQSLAELRYEIETGKTLEPGQESQVSLDGIQKTACR